MPTPAPLGLHAWNSHVAGGAANGRTPLDLLAGVLALPPDVVTTCSRLVVGCATPVGAQAAELGRLAALAAGWPASTVAFAVGGGGAMSSFFALTAAADAARCAPGSLAVAAGVEVPSLVPRGAATVRDYGRLVGPAVPESHLAERLAAAMSLDAHALAEAIAVLCAEPLQPPGRPVVLADGVQAADAFAPEVDAAAAVVLGEAPGAAVELRSIVVRGGEVDDLIGPAAAAAADALAVSGLSLGEVGSVVTVDELAVSTIAVYDLLGIPTELRAGSAYCLRAGSAPGADGLRAVAEAAARVTAGGAPVLVVVRGSVGLAGAAVVGAPAR